MTNDPLDSVERGAWLAGFPRDPRFAAALRLDSALIDWPRGVPALRAARFDVDERLSRATCSELRRYLVDWAERMRARYMAISLPPTFAFPDAESATSRLLAEAVVPALRECGLPLALMIGVRRAVNPRLGLAGDGMGRSNVQALERFAGAHPQVRVLATYLSREDQHAPCVARKFANLVPFGCWWFVNQPVLIREITAMRLDMLGLTFIPQHSDARVLEQLVFKWARSREIIADVLAERVRDLAALGMSRSDEQLRDDVARLLDGRLVAG